jgi:hypothetical protein
MALNANALVSLADLKVYLKETGTTFDAVLEILINHMSTAFDKICVRNLAEQTYTNQLYDGNDRRRLYLKHYPINLVSNITEDDDSLTLGVDEDFIIYPDEGYLLRMNGNWSNADFQNIDVTYKGGYVAIARFNFDSGSEEPVIGDTLTTTLGSGVVTAIKLTSGAWGSGTAAGQVEVATITGEYANNEVVAISGGTSDVMTVNEPGGSAKNSPGVPGDLKLAAMMQLGRVWKEQDKAEWGETSRSFGDGTIGLSTEDLLPFVKEVLERYKRKIL